jgi:hypothetical protein
MSAGCRACSAATLDGEVLGVGHVPHRVAQPDLDRVEKIGREFDHGVATLADRMVMPIVGQVKCGPSVTEMDMGHDAERFELIEGAVHRADVNPRVFRVDSIRKIVGGEMFPAVQFLEHGPLGVRDPAAGQPHLRESGFDPIGHYPTVATTMPL